MQTVLCLLRSCRQIPDWTLRVPLQIDSAKIGLHMLSFMCFVTEGPAFDMVCRCIAANEFCDTISDSDGGGG